VEFCLTTGSFTAADRATALAALEAKKPEFSKPPTNIQIHQPTVTA